MQSPARTSDPVSLPVITASPVLTSEKDASVNFVRRGDFPGAVEARYVRRCDSEVIVYLSSQTGCRKACRFCHLTQSGQTDAQDLPLEDYVRQAAEVLEHYDTTVANGGPQARTCNFNFMSRGEVLANEAILTRGDDVLFALGGQARQRGLAPRFKLSTILPAAELAGRRLTDLFSVTAPDIYYSIYSVDEAWRRRWLPKAMPAAQGLELLADWAQVTRKVPVLHFALIASENDSEAGLRALAAAVRQVGLRCDINLVRYNPYSDQHGAEPSEQVLADRAALLAAELPFARVQTVGRVGHDVKASCGMFVAGTGTRPDRARLLADIPAQDSTRSAFTGFGH